MADRSEIREDAERALAEARGRVIEHGPSCGTFWDRPIPAWIITGDGRKHHFVGTGESPFDLSQLGPGESVIAPGLIYRAESAPTTASHSPHPLKANPRRPLL